jgi:integrase
LRHTDKLRLTCACQDLERGGCVAAFQKSLGHASVTTTERYARLLHDYVTQDTQQVGGLTGDGRQRRPEGGSPVRWIARA